MKSSIVLLITFFLLLENVGCRKETVGPVTNTNVQPVVDTTTIVQPVTDTTKINEPVTDTTTIVPWPPSPGEVVFESLNWLYLEDYFLVIPYFGQRLPPGAVFKIYIKRWASPEWIEVPLNGISSDPANQYGYSVATKQDGANIYYSGDLSIRCSGEHVSDGPSVKIVY